jgi:hypothetical protein
MRHLVRRARFEAAIVVAVMLVTWPVFAQAYLTMCCASIFLFSEQFSWILKHVPLTPNAKGDHKPPHLIASAGQPYPERCQKIAQIMNNVNNNSYYPLLIVARICEVVITNKGAFEVKFHGSLPFVE